MEPPGTVVEAESGVGSFGATRGSASQTIRQSERRRHYGTQELQTYITGSAVPDRS